MTNDIASGEHGPYRWYQSSGAFLYQLLAAVPGLVLNRFVAITAFDSGPLHLSTDETSGGWIKVAEIAVSPRVRDPDNLPRGEYDEWYTFSQFPALDCPEVFVNYTGFQLHSSSLLVNGLDPTWDRSAAQEASKVLRGQQQRFWDQIVRIQPESYLAEGESLICVTRERSLLKALHSFFAV